VLSWPAPANAGQAHAATPHVRHHPAPAAMAALRQHHLNSPRGERKGLGTPVQRESAGQAQMPFT